jgi:hypothetical protein
MTGEEAARRWEAEKAELLKAFTPKPRDEKAALILACSEYRSGENDINTVYMGGLATSRLIRILGGRYGQDSVSALVNAATDATLLQAFDVCAPVYSHMIKNPVGRCECCSQIIPLAKAKSEKKETVSRGHIDVAQLGSGYAALHMVDVTDNHGTYQDVQQTGIGRYATREEAIVEAKSWSASDEIPLAEGLLDE